MIGDLPAISRSVLAAAYTAARDDGRSLLDGEALLVAAATSADSTELTAAFASLVRSRSAPVADAAARGPDLRDLDDEVKYALAHAWRFSVLFGRDGPRPDDIILGLLFETDSWASQLAASAGVSFLRAYQLVCGRADALPPDAFTPRPRKTVAWGAPVTLPVAAFGELLPRLRACLPEGAPLAFNHDNTVAWLRTSDEVDLTRILDRLLNGAGERAEESTD